MAWMGSMASVAAITALNTTNYEDGIAFHAIAEKLWLGLNKTSTDTADNTSVWAAVPSGRWHLIGSAGGGGGGSTVTVSVTPPGAIQPSGTVYVWAENDTATYPADSEGRYPNSLITYVSNGTVWLVTNAKKIVYGGSPLSIGKPPNDSDEKWMDTSTVPSTRFEAIISNTNGLDWEQI